MITAFLVTGNCFFPQYGHFTHEFTMLALSGSPKGFPLDFFSIILLLVQQIRIYAVAWLGISALWADMDMLRRTCQQSLSCEVHFLAASVAVLVYHYRLDGLFDLRHSFFSSASTTSGSSKRYALRMESPSPSPRCLLAIEPPMR